MQSCFFQNPKSGFVHNLTSICTSYARRFYTQEFEKQQEVPQHRGPNLQHSLITLQQIIQAVFCVHAKNCTHFLRQLPLLSSLVVLKVTAMKVNTNLSPKWNYSQAVIFNSWAVGATWIKKQERSSGLWYSNRKDSMAYQPCIKVAPHM